MPKDGGGDGDLVMPGDTGPGWAACPGHLPLPLHRLAAVLALLLVCIPTTLHEQS